MKIQPYLDAIRGVDGLPVGNSDSGYLLNPQVSLRDFFLNDIPRIVPLGADGLVLESFAAVALPDKNALYPLGRENFAASWMQMAQVSRRELGFVAMNGSNVYAAPYADRLDVVTLDSTHYDLFNETVPFYHIAMHGLVSYNSQWYNLISDGRRIFLRQVEYGALPNFVLTQESSARLFRTQANQLFSSRYGYWRDEVVRQYNEVAPLAFLQTQFITNHERLAEGVYCTTYESGARVIVNYNMEPYKGETFSVPAQDFIVVEGN